MSRLPDEYFDAMYRDARDPWSFEERWYEQRKRALTLAALPYPRFATAFEPGCSIGVLTADLLTRCDRVVATDIAQAALDSAAQRLGPAVTDGRVDLLPRSLDEPWPDETFDLIVLSEVGYYLDAAALEHAAAQAAEHLAPGGVVLAVHWRHSVEDYPLTGDAVHEILANRPDWVCTGRYRDRDVIVETFERPPALSVAERGGLTERPGRPSPDRVRRS
ncbi:methyltransferase domain-containing protein [Rhodococcus rhodnii]|uniref:Methyltransferase domain-containing protein n=2 Tax=Rhodococcus rhodnii TaxID=38312 RepID=A0A6P2CJ10_9NOCA|nr:methyltransferase [Rhodococcus rhodnii]EOM78338.1 putative SAM dependent methyltransferase [Rhodococcus rhodnii LMG 5362]TXG91176.1 methyltransferase domain-containing protein [Rhodococcus rhodnii]